MDLIDIIGPSVCAGVVLAIGLVRFLATVPDSDVLIRGVKKRHDYQRWLLRFAALFISSDKERAQLDHKPDDYQ